MSLAPVAWLGRAEAGFVRAWSIFSMSASEGSVRSVPDDDFIIMDAPTKRE